MDKPVTAMSNIVKIYIFSSENLELSGYLYSDYFEASCEFKTAWEMVDILERLYNRLSFPQAGFEFRSFEDKGSKNARTEVGLVSNTRHDQNEAAAEQSSNATFVVRVQFRQNATWQGTVDWLDGKKTKHFRSTLELLKLMDEAVSMDDPEHRTKW